MGSVQRADYGDGVTKYFLVMLASSCSIVIEDRFAEIETRKFSSTAEEMRIVQG